MDIRKYAMECMKQVKLVFDDRKKNSRLSTGRRSERKGSMIVSQKIQSVAYFDKEADSTDTYLLSPVDLDLG